MNKIPMTASGYQTLQNDLKKLKNKDRPNIIAAIAEARSHGDLSENAEYQYAKEQQSLIEGKIADLESAVSRAEVIDVKSLEGNEIKFGATVVIEDDDNGEEIRHLLFAIGTDGTFQLLSSDNAAINHSSSYSSNFALSSHNMSNVTQSPGVDYAIIEIYGNSTYQAD